MALETVTGIIEAISKDGKRFKLDNEQWYGCYMKESLQAERGQEVSFAYKPVEKGGRVWNNVQGLVQPTSGSPAATSSGSSSSVYKRTEPLLPVSLARERAIIRQNALTAAVNYIQYCGETVTPEAVINVAREFEAYTSGDTDIEEAKEALKSLEDTGSTDDGD